MFKKLDEKITMEMSSEVVGRMAYQSISRVSAELAARCGEVLQDSLALVSFEETGDGVDQNMNATGL